MRILLIGSNGLLGSDLCDMLLDKHEIQVINHNNADPKVSKADSHLLDITDQEKTYKLLTKINPDLIINTVALSNVDECEKDPDSAYRVNALGVRNIALACQRFDTALCHISTDYVFSGDDTPKEGYSEFNRNDPQNVYGKSKLLGEYYVKHLLNKFYILRTALLFGKKRQNFGSIVVQSVKERKKIRVVKDQYGSPTYTRDVAEAVSRLIEKPLYGIYHMTNSGGSSRQEFAEEIFKILGKSTEVEIVDKGKVYFAKRPADSRLKNYMWQLEKFEPLRPWQEALKDFISEIK